MTDNITELETYLFDQLAKVDQEWLPGIYRLREAGTLAAEELARERTKMWELARHPIIQQLVKMAEFRGPKPVPVRVSDLTEEDKRERRSPTVTVYLGTAGDA